MCNFFMRQFFRKHKLNNKGFTLVELVAAIAILAIVVTPLMNSFISSARINRNARKVMVATDVAQNLIEGYSEKTFESIVDAVNKSGTKDMTGTAAFTTFNDGVYNLSTNWISLNSDSDLTSAITEVTNKSFKFNSVEHYTKDNISDNTITNSMNSVFATSVIAQNVLSQNKVCYFMAKATEGGAYLENEGILMMSYTNIQGYNGYKFNAVIMLMPTASSLESTQLYYTYNIKVTMYDAEDATANSFGEPIITLLGGLASK